MFRTVMLCTALALPSSALAKMAVLIDFTEQHQVDTVKLSDEEARAVLEQLPGRRHLRLDECQGENDQIPVQEVQSAVRGDFLNDGKGPQLLVLVAVFPCKKYPSPHENHTTLALVRSGQVLAHRKGLNGNAHVEVLVRPEGARGLTVLTFGSMNMGVTGDTAEIWAANGPTLERVEELGPVRVDSCSLGREYTPRISAAVFFVKQAAPLRLVQKNYQRRCPPEGKGMEAPARWTLLNNGRLEP